MLVENEKSDFEKINELLLNEIFWILDMFGNFDNNVQFYIGEEYEEMQEYSEFLSFREEKFDNNFYFEGDCGKFGEDDNNVDVNFEIEFNVVLEKSFVKVVLFYLVVVEFRILSFNDFYNEEED